MMYVYILTIISYYITTIMFLKLSPHSREPSVVRLTSLLSSETTIRADACSYTFFFSFMWLTTNYHANYIKEAQISF